MFQPHNLLGDTHIIKLWPRVEFSMSWLRGSPAREASWPSQDLALAMMMMMMMMMRRSRWPLQCACWVSVRMSPPACTTLMIVLALTPKKQNTCCSLFWKALSRPSGGLDKACILIYQSPLGVKRKTTSLLICLWRRFAPLFANCRYIYRKKSMSSIQLIGLMKTTRWSW